MRNTICRDRPPCLIHAPTHGRKFATKDECKQEVMDWLHFYNHRRLHSTLDYMSPMQFEAKWPTALPQKAA